MNKIFLTIAALIIALFVPVSAGAAPKNPHEKSTITDIQWRISYSVEVPGNCAVVGFSQWEASKFRGWDAVRVSLTSAYDPTQTSSNSVSPAPLYDDQLKYGGNTLSPPNGSHWALIGDGSFRAGPPPAEAECQAMLERSQASIFNNKVTTLYTRTPLCVTHYNARTKSQAAVKRATRAFKNAKSPAARASTRVRLIAAQRALTKAKTSFIRSCS